MYIFSYFRQRTVNKQPREVAGSSSEAEEAN
ncbi:hypothetical protein PVAP13_9NG567473 [Panicum virgatum]|uniref:Uncharacterized protein n=1 Tax=Panicum virgatum TaxID=38727 RepID=A0A8T0MPB6_PANVG|nr:hypothetical protein PVAP13_9NG567473 [Panicum virgatum]